MSDGRWSSRLVDFAPLIGIHVEPRRQTRPYLRPRSLYRITKLSITPATHEKPSIRSRSFSGQHIRTFRYCEQHVRIPVAQQTVHVPEQIEHYAFERHSTVLRPCAGMARPPTFQLLDDECGQEPAGYFTPSECTEQVLLG